MEAQRFSDEHVVAQPGWVVLEDLGTPEEQTVGGLIIPNDEGKNSALLHQARVVDAGVWISKRSGADVFGKKDWLKKGELVIYIAHNDWQPPGSGNPKLRVIYSDDVVASIGHAK